ncbi:hypothetical protein MRO13_13075 [Vibrio metschnikovii]|uniref:ATP-grasp fold amidoligase family protein n=1 Tax=Vibrio metschnikovii TaxID=28172 RepID=UPI00331C9716
MNYKNIIKNKKLRLYLLSLMQIVPDQLMIKLQYRIKTGRKLNLISPKRFTEKVQWYKLFYRNPLIPICSDKYAVRKYISEKGYSHLLNELYAVYNNVDEIDLEKLPKSFIIKHTNGSGKNIIVHDKELVDLSHIHAEISKWLTTKNVNYGREWGYDNVQSRIIVEALLPRDENNDLPDYKFFCFNGRAEFLYTMIDYVDDHNLGKCSFFTRDFKRLPYSRSEYMPIEENIEKPKNFEDMLLISEQLSKEFPHVRVDFYNIDGRIVFGELTFYNASGYTVFNPDDFDYILGDKFILPDNS